MSKSTRLLLAGVLLVGGLVYLIGTAVSDSTMYYVTVDEVLAQGLVTSDQSMRMSGDVVAGSIEWSPREMLLTFAVAGEAGEALPAVYHGPRPDNFVDGSPAILEGRFDANGVFQVETLMLACPSRFVAEGEEV